ncbi:hypothetical protein H0B56_15090 [Haloechinothrix sp. YIM 98757]|uniref:Uncharacterized protein n=1 Tax=Haloechinothrix aidingensis TaxID=2752311 RepID=A0A838ACF9_9PSEU|nr:hypothetical protein [Haloechinothrix aidingensis]MBA0126875.1 hypothetical protein [Haloechinothrix aidingensis]
MSEYGAVHNEQNPQAVVGPPGASDAERSRAVRTVAAHATDAGDLEQLLDMLGLAAGEAREPGSAPDQITRAHREALRAAPRNRRLLASELATVLTSGSSQEH